jgi:hypothetical protein
VGGVLGVHRVGVLYHTFNVGALLTVGGMFFVCTGQEFFEKLDRDQDGRVSVQDVRDVMRRRKLPESYASQFIAAARGPHWWSNSIRHAQPPRHSSCGVKGREGKCAKYGTQ